MPGVLEPLAATLLEADASEASRVAGLRAVAVGWATVELDRAARELGAGLGISSRAFDPAPEDEALGARCRVAKAVLPGGRSVVLLEPSTEGRLAATLARAGEGPAVAWSVAADPPGALDALSAAGIATAAARDGPLGAARLILDGPVHGPHRFLIAAGTGTIVGMTDIAALSLRPASPADAEAIATLFTDEGYPAGPSDILVRLGRFDSERGRVVVAEHDGAILGFIALHALPRFEHGDWIVRILALVVDAGARERGVGRALMAEAERIGRAMGAAFIELTAGHHRPEARHLYESLGYDATVTAYLRKKL